jgi:hypothetical protein
MKGKKLFQYIIWLFLIIPAIEAQEDVTRKVLLSLQPKEYIITNESCLNISSTDDQPYLVTWQDKLLYVYENSVRKGPYKNTNEIKFRNCGEDKSAECSVFNYPEQEEMMQLYVEVTDAGAYNIKFKGQTYGPYTFVSGFHVSPDKSMFVAVAANQQMKFSLITSDGLQQNIDGTFERIIISPSGNQYLVLVKETEGIDMSALSKMSGEELMKYMQEQAQKQQNAGEPLTQIYGTGGKLYGKYRSSDIYPNNPAYCQTGGDNWYMVFDNALYVNGHLLKQFDDNFSVQTCKVWLSADGKRYALVGYNEIIFSDGNSYPPPIQLKVEKSAGKTILKWIALENGKDLVSYSKEL